MWSLKWKMSYCTSQEASEQFADLQGDLRRYLGECEAVKEAKQQADNRWDG